MAVEVPDTSSSGWLSIFTSLPPQLQGVFVVVAALVVGYFAYNKFIKQLRGDAPQSTEFAFGEPTTFADMGPVREVVKNMSDLLAQLIRTEAAHIRIATAIEAKTEFEDRIAEAMDRLGELMTTFLNETRERQEEADIRAAEERGYARALEEKSRRPTRRRSTKKSGV